MRKLRDVLRLRLSGGLSIREISRITKLSVGGVDDRPNGATHDRHNGATF